jgi:hypothetical protein
VHPFLSPASRPPRQQPRSPPSLPPFGGPSSVPDGLRPLARSVLTPCSSTAWGLASPAARCHHRRGHRPRSRCPRSTLLSSATFPMAEPRGGW